MELQGRELKINMRGEDVRLLQEELGKLGFSIEDQNGFYGRITRQAVLEFQRMYNLYRYFLEDYGQSNVRCIFNA